MSDIMHNLFRYLGVINPDQVGNAHGNMYAYENMHTPKHKLPPYEDFIFYQHHFLTPGIKRRYVQSFAAAAQGSLSRIHSSLNIK